MSFGGAKPSVQPLPVMPKKEDPAIAEAERLEKERLKNAQGRASTILTGGEGVLGSPDTRRRSLLTTLGA
jgi:hypothetical protein